jgi:hypothetical protein
LEEKKSLVSNLSLQISGKNVLEVLEVLELKKILEKKKRRSRTTNGERKTSSGLDVNPDLVPVVETPKDFNLEIKDHLEQAIH